MPACTGPRKTACHLHCSCSSMRLGQVCMRSLGLLPLQDELTHAAANRDNLSSTRVLLPGKKGKEGQDPNTAKTEADVLHLTRTQVSFEPSSILRSLEQACRGYGHAAAAELGLAMACKEPVWAAETHSPVAPLQETLQVACRTHPDRLQKTLLVDRLMETEDQSAEALLKKISERRKRCSPACCPAQLCSRPTRVSASWQAEMKSVAAQPCACRAGLPERTVEVRFENLTVTAPINVGSSGLPTITNSYKNQLLVRAACRRA